MRTAWRWLRHLVLVAFVATLFLVALGLAFFMQIRQEVEAMYAAEITSLEGYRPPVSVEIYDRHGERFDSFAAERRIWVPLDELPPHVWRAFLAAEDRRFLEHPGIDLTAIARAAKRNLESGQIKEGGSTITQQLAKNLVTGDAKTYERKIKEALVALELERQLTKHQLLELYLNQIYLGSGAFGLEAAARRYFQKPAAQLNPGQAAMIAGLIPAPSRYTPENSPAMAKQRRREVLMAMVDEGWVAADEAEMYLDDPVRYAPPPPDEPELGAAYRTMVRRELRRLFGAERIFREGLRVVTPYDEDVQRVAEQAVWDATSALQDRQGYEGAVDHLEPGEREDWITSGAGLPKDDDDNPVEPQPGDCFQAMVEGSLSRLRSGPMTWSLDRGDWYLRVRPRPDGGGGGSLAYRVRTGDIVNVCRPEEGEPGVVAFDRTPWAEAGVVVIDNRTGGVVALVGGKNDVLEGFVRAVQARRQPGSTMKPFVYGTALRLGHSQLDTVVDAPIALPGGNGRIWAPRNYDGGFFGPLPYRVALAFSRNVPAVRIALAVGTRNIVETARLLGVESPLREDYTLALGSSEITPMDQAVSFSTIARLGEHRDPIYLSEVYDMDGHLLGTAGETLMLDDGALVTLPGAPRRALEPGVAYELADMLNAVMEIGTGARAKAPDHARYGKTGTTNDFTDAWFVGFNHDYTTAVWVGTDTPRPIGNRETGSRTALPAWQAIMDHLGTPSRPELPMPPDAVRMTWRNVYVGLARRNVPERELPRPSVGDAPLPAFPAPRPEIETEGPAANRDEAAER